MSLERNFLSLHITRITMEFPTNPTIETVKYIMDIYLGVLRTVDQSKTVASVVDIEPFPISFNIDILTIFSPAIIVMIV